VRRAAESGKGVKAGGRWSEANACGSVPLWLARLTFPTGLGRVGQPDEPTAAPATMVGEPVDTAVRGCYPDQADPKVDPRVERRRRWGITLRENRAQSGNKTTTAPAAWPLGNCGTHRHQTAEGPGAIEQRLFKTIDRRSKGFPAVRSPARSDRSRPFFRLRNSKKPHQQSRDPGFH